MKVYGAATLVLVAMLLTANPLARASAQTANPPAGQAGAPSSGQAEAPAMPLELLLPMTVHEAWVASGRNEDRFFDLVEQLARLSASKRNVTLPDTEAAGKQAGARFKEIARRDPGQLLYVVVDRMVQHFAARETAAQAAGGSSAPPANSH